MIWLIPICLLLLTSCSSDPEAVLSEKPIIETTGKIDVNYFNNLMFEEGVEIWSNALLFKEKIGDSQVFSGKDIELVLSKSSCYDDTAFKYGMCYRESKSDTDSVTYESLLEENLDVKINAVIGENYLELSTSGLVEIKKCFKIAPDSNLDIGKGTMLKNVKYIDGGCN
jgi:hypothetical protein